MEQITWESVEVLGAHNGLTCFIFESNLRDNCKFKEVVGFWVAKDMNDFLMSAQPYINYKEKKLPEEVLKRRQSNKAGNDGRCSDGEKTKGSRLHLETTLCSTRLVKPSSRSVMA